MRNSATLLAVMALSASAALAQSGFSTQTYTAGQDALRPNQLQSANFIRGGKPDLLLYGNGSAGAIVLNDGNGGLNGGGHGLGSSGSLGNAQIGDMNGDGAPDVVGCVEASGTNQTSLVIELNDGEGNFKVAQTIALPGTCMSVNLGDVNKDGHLDVVVTSISGNDPVNNIFQTYFGDGTGQLGAPITQQNVNLDAPQSNPDATNCSIYNVVGGDFYGDGTYSLIANTYCLPPSNPQGNLGTAFLAHGNADGEFTFTQIREGNESLSGKTFDVNQDGKPDSVFVNYDIYPGFTPNLYYAQNNGGGNFTFNNLTSLVGQGVTVTQFISTTVADFNHDGYNDIAVTFMAQTVNGTLNTYVAILNGSSSGTFTQSQQWLLGDTTTSWASDITAADFNGDGYPDLATLSYNESNGYTTLYEYLNTPGDSTSSCALPAKAGTSIICQPANGSTVNAPVVVTAASNEPGFTLNRLYLDGVALYQNPAQSISTQINASAGSHTLTMVSYNSSGQAISTTTSFDVRTGGGGACLPSGPSAKICEPASGANVNSPVTVTAGAIANNGNITAIRVYLDYNPIGTFNNPSASNSFSINQPFVIGTGTHTLAIVGYQSTGGSVTASESIYVSGGGGCLPSSAGVLICAPTAGAAVNSPVTITAGAVAQNGAGGITGIRAYIDNVAVFFVQPQGGTNSYQTSQQVTVTPGSHHLVVVGYENSGAAITSSEYFTAGNSGACIPSTPGVILCSPGPNATVSSPVQISAAAMAQSGYITAIRVYLDNVAQFLAVNSQQSKSFAINQPLAISTGTHDLVIVGYQSTGGAAAVSDTITVH